MMNSNITKLIDLPSGKSFVENVSWNNPAKREFHLQCTAYVSASGLRILSFPHNVYSLSPLCSHLLSLLLCSETTARNVEHSLVNTIAVSVTCGWALKIHRITVPIVDFVVLEAVRTFNIVTIAACVLIVNYSMIIIARLASTIRIVLYARKSCSPVVKRHTKCHGKIVSFWHCIECVRNFFISPCIAIKQWACYSLAMF